jgi:phage-related baseplate assembly protein
MPALPSRSQQIIVQQIAAGIQGRASQLIDFSIGSPLRAIAEGFAGVFLWFQALVFQLLTAIRLATSSGNDVDTFCADFMPLVPGTASPRLGAQAATGTVVYSRFTAASSTCFIPVGATMLTADGSQSFAVIANPAYTTYSAALNGYTLAANVGSITVPVQAQTGGSGGNVAAGAISQNTTTIAGIDTVSNPAAFTNGANQESDAALKCRFSAYILGLSRGDAYGLAYAISSLAVNVQWQYVESYSYAGTWQPGYYYVVADDGSGSPPSSFMTAVTNAVNSVRPLGTQIGVFPPTVNFVTVSMIITTAAGYDHPTAVGLVSTAVSSAINGGGLGNGLNFNEIPAWAFAVPGVTAISSLLLNGLSGDAASIAANPQVTIKCNSVIVS